MESPVLVRTKDDDRWHRRDAGRDRSRIAALDVARALGVVAMVIGHSLDAMLAPAARETPLLIAYWKVRGFTAPLFLAAAGWAATVAVLRNAGEGPFAVVRRKLPRILLLLALGYALRWPGWAAERLRAGDRAVWAHLLAFDALHVIASSLLAASVVLGLRWTRRQKALAFSLLAILSVALGMAPPAPLPLELSELPATPVGIAFAQAIGGTSTFPLFPWAGYFFFGSLLGLVLGNGVGHGAVVMGLVGSALVLATAGTGVGVMPSGHPVLFAYRCGILLLAFAAFSVVSRAKAARVAPLGRASLGVYAFHVALVYGWSTHEGLAARVGPSLSLLHALGAAALVLAASVGATAAAKYVRFAAHALAVHLRPRRGSAWSASSG